MFQEFYIFKNHQGGRGGKGRDAGFHISHGKGRDFFQFPIPHEKKTIFYTYEKQEK